MNMQLGTLFIVATPIGNPDDITLRAIETLKAADAIICEEARIGTTLLKRLGVTPKEIILVNEHNEQEQTQDIIVRLCNGQNLALISDCGTPVFADPGHYLIAEVTSGGLKVVPIPGASSLMATLSILDFKPERFYFAGFLPRDPEQRRRELTRLHGLNIPVVVMDTPYRMDALLEDVSKVFGKGATVTLACNLTLPNEAILRGPVGTVRQQANKRKAEFILVIH